MARRKTTKEALAGKPAGWESQFDAPDTSPPATKKLTFKRKTYLMDDPLINRIKAAADAQNVGVNEFHRYLCHVALDLIESGEHTPDVQEEVVVKRSLGV